MNSIVQIVPITEMRLHHSEVLAMLAEGPVVLAQRSKPAAVLVSVEEWNLIAARLKLSEAEVAVERQTFNSAKSVKPDRQLSQETSEPHKNTPFTPLALAGLWQGVTVDDEDIEKVREMMWTGFGAMPNE